MLLPNNVNGFYISVSKCCARVPIIIQYTLQSSIFITFQNSPTFCLHQCCSLSHTVHSIAKCDNLGQNNKLLKIQGYVTCQRIIKITREKTTVQKQGTTENEMQ